MKAPEAGAGDRGHSTKDVATAPFRRLVPVTLAAFLLALFPTTSRLHAFEIGISEAALPDLKGKIPDVGLPIHEEITAEAIRTITPDASPLFVQNVQRGVENTDWTHSGEPRYHFDNSTVGNGGFDAGFQNVHDRLVEAKNEATVCDPACRLNPVFLKPIHATFRDIAEDVVATLSWLGGNWKCKFEEYACPSSWFAAQATVIQVEVIGVLPNPVPDPDRTYSGLIGEIKAKVDESLGKHCRPGGILGSRCYEGLEDMLTDDRGFQDKAKYLRTLQQEIEAYRAWQHLGHAFHTAQDFFAHSNYVELAAGKKGPPCSPSVMKPDLCDTEISGILPSLIPLPLPSSLTLNLASFRDQFSLAGLRRVLGDTRTSKLETGWFQVGVDWCRSNWGVPTPGPNTNSHAGFQYCHYETTTTPGLNKDRPYKSGEEPAHKNHEYARSAAIRLSAQLWAAFLHDLPTTHPATPAPPRTLIVQMSPARVVAGEQTSVIVTATDGSSPLAGTVHIGSDSFRTNTQFVYSFVCRRTLGVVRPEPVTVSTPGFADALASYTCLLPP